MTTRPLAVFSFALAAVLSLAGLRASGQVAPKETSYDVAGKYYDTCACPVSCSCGANVTLPAEGHCDGVVLLDIERGQVGGVKMDGLKIAVVERTPKGQKVGDAFHIKREMDLLTVYLDDRASPQQREVMPTLLAGLFGSEEVKGFKLPQWVPMRLHIDGDVANFEMAGGGKLTFEIQNVDLDKTIPRVPRSEPGKRITLTNVAPFPFIHDVTQGYSKSFRYADLGVKWDYENRNAFFGTFAASGVRARSVVDQTTAELIGSLPDLKGLEPARDQEELPGILRKVGERVEAFFRNFPNTASLEEVREERLQPNGKVRNSLRQRFQYLCLMSTDQRDLAFQEYRKRLGVSSVPSDLTEGFMLTAGFTSASIRFHPEYQSESAFRHLGRQRIDGREAFVIGFAQRPETARLTGTFRTGQTSVSTFDQGLAWVDSTTYQIVRMRTDLLRPVAEVRLERVTTDAHFGEVHFTQSPVTVWLPREVAVTVEWNGRLLRNTHTYSEFKLFNVESSQKQKAPGNAVESTR